ncbi:MAG: ATP-binding protein, partial [Myxococcales bacterium]
MERAGQTAIVDTRDASDPLLARHGSEHIVQFYEEEGFLREAVARFLASGIVADEKLVVIATPEHRQQFEQALEKKGIDVARAISGGRFVRLDARATLASFMDGARPDAARFRATLLAAIGPGTDRIRAFGEMVDLLWREGNQQGALELEQLWNDFGRERSMSLLCAYVMGNFFKEADGMGFRGICDAHDQVFPAESYSDVDDAEKRLREISVLQQRARALETELSRRRELEEALRSARSEAEAASRAKDEFLAMLGHELRNPLSPILTALELMKLRGDGRTAREQEVIERQTRHLIRLVDDLLDVSRITRGAVELRKQPVELRDVLAKATEIASPLLEQRRHHFEVHAPEPGLRLYADEARLAQVIANLLTNAAKYTEPGGHIRLMARRERGQALIEVRDDGMGIEPELLPRVFDLFVQGRQSADRSAGGLGIGLSLVRNLVAMHGGTVEARSSGAGRGSTFTVRLPALDGDAAALAVTSREELVRAAGVRRRVLVVDDN